MVSAADIQRIARHTTQHPIVSLYLDMSVNSDNKRTYQTFLNKQRSHFPELDSDREQNHRAATGEVFSRAEDWLATSFDQRCKGAALFMELGGEWFEAISYPRPLMNAMTVNSHAMIGPLQQALANERRWGVMMVDREHFRLLSIFCGEIEEDHIIEPDAYPTPHDVQAGGYAQKDYQKWKAEETRQFFRQFADVVQQLEQRAPQYGYVLLGTNENTQHFKEFLSDQVCSKLACTTHAPPNASNVELVRFLEPLFEEAVARDEARAIDQLLERVRTQHLAASGWHQTLTELQEGKVDRLFISRSEQREGVQCTRCGFYLVRRDGDCPYCGGALRDGIDLVESVVRMAADREVQLEFVAADAMNEVNGVGALLKFR